MAIVIDRWPLKTKQTVRVNVPKDLKKVGLESVVSTDTPMHPHVEVKLSVEEIGDSSHWALLKGPWERFLQDSEIYDPFLSHEWFDCCLHAFQEQKTLSVLLVKQSSRILGIAPLWRFQGKVRNIPVTRIGFISCLDTPYVDFIVSKHRREEVLKAIFEHLFINRKQIWDVLTLPQWPSQSKNYLTVRKFLSQFSEKNKTELASLTPFIELKDDWDSFLRSRSARFRKTRRNIMNKFAKLDNVEVQCVRMDSDGKILQEVLDITGRSWKCQEGIAIASTEQMRKFFQELTKVAGEKGWLLLWILRINGAPVGMEYDLVGDKNVYALRADFDEAYAEYSPGTYLESEILQRLFEENIFDVYNTGPGVNSYKLHSTENLSENVVVNIFNDSVKGKILWGIENVIIPLLRHVRALVVRQEKK